MVVNYDKLTFRFDGFLSTLGDVQNVNEPKMISILFYCNGTMQIDSHDTNHRSFVQDNIVFG